VSGYVLVHVDRALAATVLAEPRRGPLPRMAAWSDLHLRATREGEVRATSRELADAWGWSGPGQVERFVADLVAAGQVEVRRLGDHARAGRVLVLVEMQRRNNPRNKTGTIAGTKNTSNGAASSYASGTIAGTKAEQSAEHVQEEEEKRESPPSGVGDAGARTHARGALADAVAPAPSPRPSSEVHRRYDRREVDRVLDALVAAGVPAECRDAERPTVTALLRQHGPDLLVQAATGLPRHRLVTEGKRPLSASVLGLPSLITECVALAGGDAQDGGPPLPPVVDAWRSRLSTRLGRAVKEDPALDAKLRDVAAGIERHVQADPALGKLPPKARSARVRLAVLRWYGDMIHDPIPDEGRALLRTG
jgi:hypothetical protein